MAEKTEMTLEDAMKTIKELQLQIQELKAAETKKNAEPKQLKKDEKMDQFNTPETRFIISQPLDDIALDQGVSEPVSTPEKMYKAQLSQRTATWKLWVKQAYPEVRVEGALEAQTNLNTQPPIFSGPPEDPFQFLDKFAVAATGANWTAAVKRAKFLQAMAGAAAGWSNSIGVRLSTFLDCVADFLTAFGPREGPVALSSALATCIRGDKEDVRTYVFRFKVAADRCMPKLDERTAIAMLRTNVRHAGVTRAIPPDCQDLTVAIGMVQDYMAVPNTFLPEREPWTRKGEHQPRRRQPRGEEQQGEKQQTPPQAREQGNQGGQRGQGQYQQYQRKGGPRKSVCFICQQEGHISYNCPQREGQGRTPAPQAQGRKN